MNRVNKMEIKGIIKKIGATKHVSDKFKTRDVILTVEDKFPQHLLIQCSQEKVLLFDNLPVGSQVIAHINLRGKEWKNAQGEVKYFNTLECWRLEVLSNINESTPTLSNEVSDGLPF